MAIGYVLNETGEQVQKAITDVRQKTIYDPATKQADGLMSSIDKKKLDEDVADEEMTIEEINALLNF